MVLVAWGPPSPRVHCLHANLSSHLPPSDPPSTRPSTPQPLTGPNPAASNADSGRAAAPHGFCPPIIQAVSDYYHIWTYVL